MQKYLTEKKIKNKINLKLAEKRVKGQEVKGF